MAELGSLLVTRQLFSLCVSGITCVYSSTATFASDSNLTQNPGFNQTQKIKRVNVWSIK